MKIVIMHQTVTNHDAIGNDIEAMCSILGEQYECVVFAENRLNSVVPYVDESALETLILQPENLLIYHHSIFWEKGEALLVRAKAKIVIRYHNLTPPEFFAPYNSFHESQCRRGREQTKRLAESFPQACWLCASAYNRLDIPMISKERAAICAPFHKIETWSIGAPDEEVMKQLIYSPAINLLSVGRIAPNKGHLFLLDIMQTFRLNYKQDVRLWIIGKFDSGLQGYNDEIQKRIQRYGLEEHVHFVGEISDSIISAYYLGCDFFMCASEHEGFCVPLEEAQYFKLPVIARRSSAIPETLGREQLILGENLLEYAAAIHVLYENTQDSQWLRQRGRENYDSRFSFGKIEKTFMNALSEWQIL